MKPRFVAQHIDEGFGIWGMPGQSDSVYSYLKFCQTCERLLDDWYPHDGARFCPFCGQEFDEKATFKDLENRREGNGPWEPHPLLVKEQRRLQAKNDKRELEHLEAWGCPTCLVECVPAESHDGPTLEEETWNPMPAGKHIHYRCPSCDFERIGWVLENGMPLYGYNPDLPTFGPLAPPHPTEKGD